ncbi:LacI family DNA-binding transcriptional regulator [Fictibacillus fluitans]|uniref:LacI family DNA-binding transcriptional regulator n=1 Tax=Fictibacillus fluitans TaxID=3058422 RepID=A0ABT8HUN6_9BACL|nr:LacI family DNA-binding transcriptional regulator [Fictibacillus sp. NE201]MDN4524487.1 LacI family DNA-binding transcriptional regulator [Fictibacillus sp. NE201]
MATIKDVAKLAGVAVSTASYALNQSSKVAPQTARKVIDAARVLNYQKNGIARDLKRNKTDTILLILHNLAGPFYSELVRGVQDTLQSLNYGLIACSSMGGRDSTASRFLAERRADGAIILASNLGDQEIERAARKDFPIVVLDRLILNHDSIMSVVVDNKSGGYEAAKHLIDRGHRDIAYLSGPLDSRDNLQRRKGFEQAMQEAAIPIRPKWLLKGEFTRQGGYLATKMLILQGDLPSAIFAGNDEMAIGAMNALKDAGIKVPRQISVIGFDDIEMSRYTTPQLTTVSQANYEVGSLSAHLIYRSIKEEIAKKDYIMPTELIIRDSSRELMKEVRGQREQV